VKEQILRQIDEALALLDEYKAAFESLTPEQVDFSEPEQPGQAEVEGADVVSYFGKDLVGV